MIQVTIYEWPTSQKCMECKHREFINSDVFCNSHYACMVNCTENDGVNCPKFESEPDEVQEEYDKIRSWLKTTTEPFDYIEWDGEELKVWLDSEVIEKYSRQTLEEEGAL